MRTILALFILTGLVVAKEPTPREQVLHLVPPDSAVCFVVQNLRDTATTVAASPFAEWAGAKFAPMLKGNADAKQIEQVKDMITAALGISLEDVRDDILGDCIAFAYQPGPKEQPGKDRGVVLLHARKPEKLQTLISKLNGWQKSGGELTGIDELQHNGRKYSKRVRANNASEFYFLNGHVFAFAAQEDAIKAVIDREASPGESPILKDLTDLKLDNAFMACWLNPRKLDNDLAAPATASPAEKAGRAQMARLWSAVDQCAFYLTATKEVEFGLSMTYRGADLPAEVKPQFAGAPVKSAIWNAIPDDAILAVAADLELNALLGIVGSFLPEEDRPALWQQIDKALKPLVGANNAKAVFAGIGPEVGVWAVKSPPDGGPLPVFTLAARITQQANLILKAINLYVQMLIFNYNDKHDDQIETQETEQDGVKLHTFSNATLFPKGVRPTYAIRDGYFIFGSDPGRVTGFQPPAPRTDAAEVPLARLAGPPLRQHILDHRDELAKYLATHQDRKEPDIRGDLDTIAGFLEAYDKIELLVRGDNKTRTFAVRMKMVKDLK